MSAGSLPTAPGAPSGQSGIVSGADGPSEDRAAEPVNEPTNTKTTGSGQHRIARSMWRIADLRLKSAHQIDRSRACPVWPRSRPVSQGPLLGSLPPVDRGNHTEPARLDRQQ